MTTNRNHTFALTAIFILMAIPAQAQWVAVARAVSGRIQRMEEQSANGKGGYDVATVVIEANAKNVYETALQRLQAHASEVKIIREDARTRTVSFTNGDQTASLQANALGDQLTQLVVASTLDPAQHSATPLVVKSIQQVCTELKVDCTLQTD
jgi:hypothetical protein